MFAFANHYRVGTRIFVGFVTILVLLCTIAAISYRNGSLFEVKLDEYAKVTNDSLAVSRIDRDILEMRRNAYVFAETGDAERNNFV